jgi:hypothetical protein
MRYLRDLIAVSLLLLPVSLGHAGQTVKIRAREHQARSRNVVPIETRWDGLVVCNGSNGMQQWECRIKTAGDYYLHVQYASGESRPVRLFINEQEQQGRYLKRDTGGFFVRDLQWDTCGPFRFSQGKNSIRISAQGNMPHLAGLIVSDRHQKPDDKLFADFFEMGPDLAGPINEDTAATRATLRRLLPGVEEILFVRRYTLQSSHYYTDFIDGCRDGNFGGNLCVLSLRDGTVRELAPDLSHGIFGRCDLSFDGQRVVFGWKENLEVGFRIWEVGIDGRGLRQLTFPPSDEAARIKKYKLDMGKNWVYKHHTDDIHP